MDDRPKLIGLPQRSMRSPDEVKAALVGPQASARQRARRHTEILARLGFPQGVLVAHDEADAIVTIAEALLDHIDALKAEVGTLQQHRDRPEDLMASIGRRLDAIERDLGALRP